MVMELLGPVLEIVNLAWAPVGKCFKYHRNLEKYMMVLNKRLEELNSRREDIESKMRIDLHSGTELKKEVKLWLGRVQRINEEIDTISHEVGERKYLSRAHLGKKVKMTIQAVKELHQEGDFADSLVIDVPQSNKVTLPTSIVIGDTTAKRTMEKIWASLMDNDVRKIGVYGMGGVGKTTIMKHIYNQLITETDTFDCVIWISVSKLTDVLQLQHRIAHAFQLGIPENESETIRAAKLFSMLTRKNYVLILDDVWEDFQLEDVGIPEPTIDNGCKLVLTTRLSDVCTRMGCKRIKVELLTEEEAWNLFVEKVGLDNISSGIEAIAKDVAKECACLPLAIITIGRSLKGVTESCEWRNALEELRESTRGLNDMRKVHEQLKFSYNHLQHKGLRLCLFYCTLYPEDSEIGRKELIEHLIVGGVIEGMKSRQAQFDRGHAMLNKLENSCLLECVTDNFENGKRVKMHDLIRDMVLSFTDIGCHSMVKAGVHLKGIPQEEKWAEDVEKVSLMFNDISEIPSNASPKCPRLSTLLLSLNHRLTRIPNSFFLHMLALEVLDLSDTSIEYLPPSMSNLEKLTALLLRGCIKLRYVPSLARLVALTKLDLCHSGVKEIPQGIESSINLKYLNLYTQEMEFLPSGILPKLLNLQVLITFGASKTLKIKGEELAGLRKLEVFSGQLYNKHDFNRYIDSIRDQGPKTYFIRVGQQSYVTSTEEKECFGKHVYLSGCFIGREENELLLPNDIQTLTIDDCTGVSSITDIFLLKNTTDLKSIQIHRCHEIECLFQSSCTSLKGLESLELQGLRNLLVLCKGGPTALPNGTFSSLKRFQMQNCQNIKIMFNLSLLLHLHSLEDLHVSFCPQMEEIIADDQEEGRNEINNHSISINNIISPPKLRRLVFRYLPNLRSIYMGMMHCDSLQVIEVFGCPKLKRIPVTLPYIPSGLKKISASMEWWESLQWDEPSAKKFWNLYFMG